MKKKILFIVFIESVIKCVRKKYRVMYIYTMSHRWKSKYVHTCKIINKPYLDIPCDEQFKRICPVKIPYLVIDVTVVYLHPSYDSQTTKNKNNK